MKNFLENVKNLSKKGKFFFGLWTVLSVLNLGSLVLSLKAGSITFAVWDGLLLAFSVWQLVGTVKQDTAVRQLQSALEAEAAAMEAKVKELLKKE